MIAYQDDGQVLGINCGFSSSNHTRGVGIEMALVLIEESKAPPTFTALEEGELATATDSVLVVTLR